MKAASADLITLLATAKQFVIVETITITLADGSVITWTRGDAANGYSVSAAETQADIIE